MILDLIVNTIIDYLSDNTKREYNPDSLRVVIRNVLLMISIAVVIVIAALIYNNSAEFKFVH